MDGGLTGFVVGECKDYWHIPKEPLREKFNCLFNIKCFQFAAMNETKKIKESKKDIPFRDTDKNSVKRIGLFGSTGSIGTQALEVIAANPDKFSAEILTAQNNDELLLQQALRFNPNIVVIGDEKKIS